MSGVKAVRYLLANDAGVTTLVTADQIMAGPLRQGVAMPAIEVKHVSTVPRNTVAGGEGRQFKTSRIQVSVKAGSYPQMQQVLAAVRAALPRTRGLVNGVKVDAVLPDTEGPDFSDEESGIFFGSHDFIVKFNE